MKFHWHGSTGGNSSYWYDMGTITVLRRHQGEMVWLRLLSGRGNNGNSNQNQIIDVTLQNGWTGGDNLGRFGCNYIIYPMSTTATTYPRIRVICTDSNVTYHIWAYFNSTYTSLNSICFYDPENFSWTPTWIGQSSEPTTGNICTIQGGYINYTTF